MKKCYLTQHAFVSDINLKRNVIMMIFSITPKWKESTNSKAVCSCMFPNCTLTSDTTIISVANFAPLEQLLTLTGITDENVSHVSLCKSHYNYIYKTVKPLAQCASCQADAK